MQLTQRFSKFYFFIVFLIMFISCCNATEPDLPKLLESGAKAPVNTLREAVSNSEYSFPEAGHWNIVFYWSLFCHSCLQEIPAVKKRLSDNDDFSVFFVALDSEQMQTALKNYSLKRKLKKPLLMERIVNDKYLTADQWGVTTTPSVFIVNPEGVIEFSHSGPMDVEEFFKTFSDLKDKAKTEKK